MITTLLVPLDGSTLAERALPYATALARAVRGRILLLHVTSAHHLSEEPLAALHQAAARLRAEGLAVEPRVYHVEEDVACAICEAARDWGVDLLVMSTHGHGLRRWPYGSVAEQALQRGEVPILLITPHCDRQWPADRPLRILVPLDGSALAETALVPACELASALGAEVRLLRVVELADETLASAADALEAAEREAARLEARQYLAALASGLRAGGLHVEVDACIGVPAALIVQGGTIRLGEPGADLIVMATHGESGHAHRVLGGVATAVLDEARVPVLLVRPAAMRPPSAIVAAPRPTAVQAAVLTLDAAELELLRRGLWGLLDAADRDPRTAEPVRRLLARIEQAQRSHPAATSPVATDQRD